MNKLNLSAKWIWTDNNKTPDARVVFRKTLELDAILAECIAYLAVDTKYWLYINGKQVVFEGGLFRESLKGCGYADRVDLAPFLVPGKNVISVLCWFYGNGGRNNTDSTQAGFLMDCPDRERGQWIGDVSVQLPQVGFVLDSNALLLAKKCIGDFIHLRDGDILRGNVPGQNSSELPSQSLNAIGSLGMIATYYRYTRDKSVLALCFEPCIHYLKLWELGENGLVRCRKGNWPWIDHLHNIDAPVCENAWYYLALEFMQFMAEELGDHRFDEFIEARRAILKENFEKTFWNGHCFASSDFVDDRANALAVLASLCGPEKCEAMRYILLTTFNSTVYMENYVLLALCRMGYVEDAYHRMVSRYTNLALNENSTLWEDFFILGSRNHAWTGAPITIAYQYFMGIDTNDGFETMTVTPNKTLFKKMACTVNGKDGLIHMKVDNVAGRVTVINGSKTRVTVQY